MSFEEPLILMDFAFFHPVATIQVITCSQFLHSHFMEVTTLNFNTNVIRGTVNLDGLCILSSRCHDSGITCSQFLHSYFVEVTTLNFNTNVIRGSVNLDGLCILSSRCHDSGHHLFSVRTQSLHGSDNI